MKEVVEKGRKGVVKGAKNAWKVVLWESFLLCEETFPNL